MIEENLGNRAQVDYNKENRPHFGGDFSSQGNFEKNSVFSGSGFGFRNLGSNSGDFRYQSQNEPYFSKDERPINCQSNFDSLRDYDNPNPAYEMIMYENLPSINQNVKPQEVI